MEAFLLIDAALFFHPPSKFLSFGFLVLRAAEAAVGAEVELRLSAACTNRGLWPRPIKEDFERLEQRLGSLQVRTWTGFHGCCRGDVM